MDTDDPNLRARSDRDRDRGWPMNVVQLLLGSRMLGDRLTRALLIELVGQRLDGPVELGSQPTTMGEFLELVRFCDGRPGGLAALAEAVTEIEGRGWLSETLGELVQERVSEHPHPQGTLHPPTAPHPHPQDALHPHAQSSSPPPPQSSSPPHPQSSSHPPSQTDEDRNAEVTPYPDPEAAQRSGPRTDPHSPSPIAPRPPSPIAPHPPSLIAPHTPPPTTDHRQPPTGPPPLPAQPTPATSASAPPRTPESDDVPRPAPDVQPPSHPGTRPSAQPEIHTNGHPTGRPAGQSSGPPAGQSSGRASGQSSGQSSAHVSGHPPGQPPADPHAPPSGHGNAPARPPDPPRAQPPELPLGRRSLHPPDTHRDFFVSYNSADRDWAVWISWQLEEAGYGVLLQDWDFVPGSSWPFGMERGVTLCERTVAVLSPAYMRSVYGRQEWLAALSRDPQGLVRRLVPVMVEACTPEGLLAGVVHIDLTAVTDGEVARARLLAGIGGARDGRIKPAVPPCFPGSADLR